MSIKKTMFWLVLFVIGIACFSVIGQAGEIEVTTSKVIVPWPINLSVKTEFLPAKAGPAAFLLTVEPSKYFDESCESIVISVTNKLGTAYSGPERWSIPASEATPFTRVVNLTIPDNDTCGVVFAAGCGRTLRVRRWFVTTGDILEMYAERPVDSRKYKPTWSDVVRAKFTPEQLQKEFDFRLDLRNTRDFQRDSIGTLISTYKPTDTPEVYLIRTSIDNWITLTGDFRATMEPVDEEAFLNEFPPADWETPPQQQDSSNTDDTLKSQSSLDKDPDLPYEGAITLERVTGLTGANTLPIGQTITYYIRINNNTGTNIRGITNGFRVYSPNGATWSSAVGDTPPV